MSLPHDPTLDFVDWIGVHVQQMKAIGTMLCWAGHGFTEEELHQVSVLIEHLTGDLEAETAKFHAKWRRS